VSPEETLSQALMPRWAEAAPHSNVTRASTAVLHDSEPTQTFDDAAAAETERNPDAILALSVLPVRIAAVMHHECANRTQAAGEAVAPTHIGQNGTVCPMTASRNGAPPRLT